MSPSPPSPEASRPGDRGRTLLLAGLVLALCLWPAGNPLRQALGSPLGEADNHLWMFWVAAQGLAGRPGPWANLPEPTELLLMDPANLPVYLLGALVDPVVGWNLLAAFSVALALIGGFWLGREVGGPEAAAPTMVALGSAPFLAGVIDLGISEAWGLGWLALHAAFLLRLARLGRAGDLFGAGLCLGLLALTGWYAALFALFAEAGLVLWALRIGGVRRLPLLLGQGLLAMAMVAPRLLAMRKAPAHWADRVRPPSPQAPPPRADWDTMYIQGADLLAFVKPSLGAVDPSLSVYLGPVLVGLVLLGLLRRPRLAGPAVLVAAPLVLLALGHWPSVAGRPFGPPGPAAWLAQAVPLLQGVSHWHRAIGTAMPFLALAAGLGLAAIPWPVMRALVGGLLLADALALSHTAWPRQVHPVDAPEVLLQVAARPEPGGIIQIPFDNGRPMFSDQPARLYDRWQIRHGRPRAESYEEADALLRVSPLVAGWQRASGLAWTLPPEQLPPVEVRQQAPLTDPEVIAAQRQDLRELGYAFVVLHADRAPTAEAARKAISAALGPGVAVGDDRYWPLSSDPPGARP